MNPCDDQPTLFRLFLADRSDLCGDQEVNYVRFDAEGVNIDLQQHTRTLLGRIVYTTAAGEYRSTRSLAIKQMKCVALGEDDCDLIFVNEIHFYSKIVPYLESIVDDGCQADSIFPEFLYSCTTALPQRRRSAIILENLATRGYAAGLGDQSVFLDQAHLSLLMRRLGRFHGYSCKAVRANPCHFLQLATFIPRIHERSCVRYGFMLNDFFRHYLRVLSTRDPRYEQPLKLVLRNFYRYLSNTGQAPEVLACGLPNVVCHGNCTGRSVRFRYESGAPVDVKFVDFGMWRLSSPVLDLAHVLYICADQRTRNRHWHTLLAAYRSGQADVLPADQVTSVRALHDEFSRHCWYALLAATYFIPDRCASLAKSHRFVDVFLGRFKNTPCVDIPPKELQEMLEQYEFGGAEGTDAMLDVIKDMIDRGFIM